MQFVYTNKHKNKISTKQVFSLHLLVTNLFSVFIEPSYNYLKIYKTPNSKRYISGGIFKRKQNIQQKTILIDLSFIQLP